MSLLVSVCAEEEQATGRHGLKHCGCLRNLGAAQVVRPVAMAIPGSDSRLRRPEAADQPARRWLSESEASLVLGIIHALCRDFLRCLITTDRPGWAIANRRYSGCRGQVARKDLEAALGGGRGRAARCRSR